MGLSPRTKAQLEKCIWRDWCGEGLCEGPSQFLCNDSELKPNRQKEHIRVVPGEIPAQKIGAKWPKTSYDGHTLSLASLYYLLIFRPWYCIIYIKQPEIIFCFKQLVIFPIESVWQRKTPLLSDILSVVALQRPPCMQRIQCFSRQGPLTLPGLALQSWTLSTEFTHSSTAAFECNFLWSVFYFVLCYSVINESLIFKKF